MVERKGLRNYLVCFWQGGKKKNHTYRECKTGTYSSYCEIAVRSGTLSRITMEWAWQPVWMQEKALLSLHGLNFKIYSNSVKRLNIKDENSVRSQFRALFSLPSALLGLFHIRYDYSCHKLLLKLRERTFFNGVDCLISYSTMFLSEAQLPKRYVWINK